MEMGSLEYFKSEFCPSSQLTVIVLTTQLPVFLCCEREYKKVWFSLQRLSMPPGKVSPSSSIYKLSTARWRFHRGTVARKRCLEKGKGKRQAWEPRGETFGGGGGPVSWRGRTHVLREGDMGRKDTQLEKGLSVIAGTVLCSPVEVTCVHMSRCGTAGTWLEPKGYLSK